MYQKIKTDPIIVGYNTFLTLPLKKFAANQIFILKNVDSNKANDHGVNGCEVNGDSGENKPTNLMTRRGKDYQCFKTVDELLRSVVTHRYMDHLPRRKVLGGGKTYETLRFFITSTRVFVSLISVLVAMLISTSIATTLSVIMFLIIWY